MQNLKLTDWERLTLQNITTRIALEKERIDMYELRISLANKELVKLKAEMNGWHQRFEKRMKRLGIEDKVSINAETGEIALENVLPMQHISET